MQIRFYVIHFCRNIMTRLLFFVQLQLFMSLLSLPILIAWGLPISGMALIGNLIFSPFLMFFLFLSSLIFFFELCSLPNNFLIKTLDWFTRCWSWCIECGNSQWLIGFAKPSLWILLAIVAGSFIILHCKKITKPITRIVCFVIVTIFIVITLKWNCQKECVIRQIGCNNGFVTVVKTPSTLTVIDPGVLGKRVNSSWVEYTLAKELVEQFGTMKIDVLIFTRPTILTLDCAAQICRLMNVSSLYLVTWQGESDKRLLQKYGRLRYELTQKNGKFFRIGHKPIDLRLGTNYTLTVKPLLENFSYKNITFSQVSFTLTEGESTLFEIESQ